MNKLKNVRTEVYVLIIAILSLMINVTRDIDIPGFKIIAIIEFVVMIVLFILMVSSYLRSKNSKWRKRYVEVGEVLERKCREITYVDLTKTVERIINEDKKLIVGDNSDEILVTLTVESVQGYHTSVKKDESNVYHWESNFVDSVLTISNVEVEGHFHYKFPLSVGTKIEYDSIRFTGLSDSGIETLTQFLADITGSKIAIEKIGRTDSVVEPCLSKEFKEKYEKYLVLEENRFR